MAQDTGGLLLDYHLLALDEVDSTNEEAKRIARGGGRHGAVVWAKRQTAGRGRYGRTWHSLPGNLFATFVLSPTCDVASAPQLSFVAALAAADAIAPLVEGEGRLALKWPNDILVDDRKLGGILLESFQHEDRLWVVVGIGVNVETAPHDVAFPAISLKDTGVEIISAKIVLSRFVHHFIERYTQWETRGFGPIRRAWLKLAWRKGAKLRAHLPNEEVDGVFKDIDDTGALILQVNARTRRAIAAADIFPLEPEQKEFNLEMPDASADVDEEPV